MKMKLIPTLAALFAFAFCGCQNAQLVASGTYVASEVAAASLIQKSPGSVPVLQLLATDLPLLAQGKLSNAAISAGMGQLLTAMRANGGNNNLTQAALIDGVLSQLAATQNPLAPSPLSGANAAIIADVTNGISAALALEANTTTVPHS
jgi:hypothetical protein